MMESISIFKNTTRTFILASVMALGISGFYSTQSHAGGQERSSTSGKSETSADQSSSGREGTSSGQGTSQKKHKPGTSGQSGSSSGEAMDDGRTGVLGDAPSGQKSETSGQKRGPTGY